MGPPTMFNYSHPKTQTRVVYKLKALMEKKLVSLGLKKQALKGKLWLQSLDSSYHYVIKTCLLVEKSRFGDTNKQVSFCWREMTVVQHWGIQPLGLYKLSPINTHHTFPNIFLDLGATLKNSKISQEFSQIICKQKKSSQHPITNP